VSEGMQLYNEVCHVHKSYVTFLEIQDGSRRHVRFSGLWIWHLQSWLQSGAWALYQIWL